MTHPKSDFLKFIGTPFEPYILPIIPVGAKLSEDSSLEGEQLGKIPGKFAWGPKVWFGFMRWRVYHTRKGDLERWQEWQEPYLADAAIAIGLRLGLLIAIDIDINKMELADEAELRCRMILGNPLCVRRREGSARRVLIYVRQLRMLPITKARVAFKHPFTGDEINAIEILGEGQQVVIEGPHAKGAMHYWLDGKGLVDVTDHELICARKLTSNDIMKLTVSTTEWIKGEGGSIHIASGRMRDTPLETEEIESPTNPFYLKPADRGLLVEAMQAINLDKNIDYDAFINLQRALCAATGCDVEFLADKVWPWVCTQKEAHGNGPRSEERGIEWLEAMWRGFKTSSLGADYVYHVAAAFGFVMTKEQLGESELAEIFGEPIDVGEGAGRDASSAPGVDGGDEGGLPPSSSSSGPPIFRAEVEPAGLERPPRRVIQIDGDYLAYAVDAAETSLIEQGVGLFSRGDAIVRPGAARIKIRNGQEIDGERLYPVQLAELREHMTQCARIVKWSAGSNQWVPTNVPEDLARVYLDRKGRWKLRALTGVITAPTLRQDGSVLDQPGYDEATGLLYRPDPNVSWPEIQKEPSREDALLALIILKGLLSTFPFVGEVDYSVALSGILTAVVRRTLRGAPLHAFSSPAAGTGKGKLVDTAAIIAFGREASAVVQGRNEEETEKRLGALLLAGDPILLLDNCTLPIEGDFICSLLTREFVNPRILGTSNAPQLPANAALFATGNNLIIESDMTRRVLQSVIDAKVEFPERRAFTNDPVEDAKRNRGVLLAAVLTIMRAYVVAGRPPQAEPLGSFEHWSSVVRDPLLWLGEADPTANQQEVKQISPERTQLAALLKPWLAVVGEGAVTAKKATELATNHPEGGRLIEAMQDVAPATGGNLHDPRYGVNMKTLGKYLRRHEKLVVQGLRLSRDGEDRDGVAQWRVEKWG